MSELEKQEELSSIISNTVSKNNSSDPDSKEVSGSININKESAKETIQMIEPEPAPVTVEDMQMKPIEINDDDEIEENNNNNNNKGKKTILNEGLPPLPKRTSTTGSLKKEANATITTNNNSNDHYNDNPILIQLKEAFPNIEEKYIIAVIIASQGMMEPAFHALLYLSDPDSNKDIELPRVNNLNTRLMDTSQLKQDELLARQLDQQYNARRQHKSDRHIPRNGMSSSNNAFDMNSEEDTRLDETRDLDYRRRRRHPITSEERREIYGEEDDDEDTWSHFVEKDIPEVANAVSTTFQETASKVSNWFNGVKNSLINPQQEQYETHGPNRNNGYDYDQEQIRQQEEALRFYERQKRKQELRQRQQQKNLPSLPGRNRFNSFGEGVYEEDVLQTHGIVLKNGEFSDNEDVPPQLPKRERKQGLTNANKKTDAEDDDLYNEEANLSIVTNENKVIPQTTYIDTPKEVATTNTQNNNDLNYTQTKKKKRKEKKCG